MSADRNKKNNADDEKLSPRDFLEEMREREKKSQVKRKKPWTFYFLLIMAVVLLFGPFIFFPGVFLPILILDALIIGALCLMYYWSQ